MSRFDMEGRGKEREREEERKRREGGGRKEKRKVWELFEVQREKSGNRMEAEKTTWTASDGDNGRSCEAELYKRHSTGDENTDAVVEMRL